VYGLRIFWALPRLHEARELCIQIGEEMKDFLKSFIVGATLLTISLALVAIAIYIYQWIIKFALGKQIVGYSLLVIVVIAFIYASYKLGESIRDEF
jgi:uncharacterized membrane protein YqjE